MNRINILFKVFFLQLGKASKKKEKKIVEFSTKVGGWGQQWTDFPFFFFEKKI